VADTFHIFQREILGPYFTLQFCRSQFRISHGYSVGILMVADYKGCASCVKMLLHKFVKMCSGL